MEYYYIISNELYIPIDILELIINNIETHKMLCILKMTSSAIEQCVSKIINIRYSKEREIIQKIVKKIDVYNGLDIKIDSLELFKFSLGWIDNDTSHINFNLCSFFRGNREIPNIDIIDMFYCDCENCFRTEPCGRGEIEKFSEEEKSFLTQYFQWDWWNREQEDELTF